MAEPLGRRAVRVEAMGESALLVVLGERIDPALNLRVHLLALHLDAAAARIPGLGATVPAYGSVLVPFDPCRLDEATVRAAIADALAAADHPGAARDAGPVVRVPVRYGGADGPDLADVAARTGRSEDAVVALHAGREYRVFCVGFVPGFPYLGLLPEELALPRRSTPRLRVPSGSVAIAGRQTGIYPSGTPGGWHVIGRTDLAVWDPSRERPALLEPGDRVRFEPA